MGNFYEEITPALIDWIKRQHVFFVATAPLNPDGHVNVSPKGIQDTFHIVNPKQVWYEDLWGSGNETISHLKENERITFLFTALQGAPKIVRLYGRGRVYEIGSPEYDTFIPPEKRKPGSRAVLVADIYSVGTSCGFAVPTYKYTGQRSLLMQYAAKMEDCDNAILDGTWDSSKPKFAMKDWWKKENAKSLDGLPGLTTALGFDNLFKNAGPGVSDRQAAGKEDNNVQDQPSTISVQQTIKKNGVDIRLLSAFMWGFLAAIVVLQVKL